MRQSQRRLCAASIAIVLILSGLGQRSSDGRVSAAPPQQAAGPCIVDVNKVVEPTVLLLGETATVRLQFSSSCPRGTWPLHLVLVVDESQAMDGNLQRAMKEALRQLVRNLELGRHPAVKVGIVGHGGTARTICRLTNDEARLLACAGKLLARGASALGPGIVEGLRVLADGREPSAADLAPVELVVGITSVRFGDQCEALKPALKLLRESPALLATVMIGAPIDVPCVRDAASLPMLHRHVSNPSALVEAFEGFGPTFDAVPLTGMTFLDKLAPDIALVDDSETPGTVQVDGKTIRWDLDPRRWPSIEVDFRIRPLEAGYLPVSDHASVDFEDTEGKVHSAGFPARYLTVFHTGAGAHGIAAESDLVADSDLVDGDDTLVRMKH